MISSKTLNIDNPKLNCRLVGYENYSPKRVILDKDLGIKLDSNIIKSAKKNNTIIFYNSFNNLKLKFLKKKGIYLVKSKLNHYNQLDLKKVIKKLFTLGIKTLLVEGGDKITKNFLTNRLFDQFYLFRAEKKLSKNKRYLAFSSLSILKKIYSNKFKISSKLAKDHITIYKRPNV